MKSFRLLKLTVFFIFMALVAFSCHEDHQGHDGEASHEDHVSSGQLTLNNGAKWQADDHTRQAMTAIRDIIKQNAAQDAAGYRQMGEQLQAKTDELIAGCTMTGDAHTQLHLFLSQFLPEVKELSAQTDAAAAEKIHGRLGALVDSYYGHFE